MKYPKEFFTNPISKFIRHMLFPSRCIFCGKVVEYNEYSCDICDKEVETFAVTFCPICEKEVCICEDKAPLEYAKSVFLHEDLPRKAVLSLKFSDNVPAARPMALYIFNMLVKNNLQHSFDVIIPIPSSKKKLRKRGYNQAQLIAVALGEFCGVMVDAKTLVKSKDTEYQHVLTAKERMSNLIGAFSVLDKTAITGKNILLLDDVYTTGSTLKECAKTLRENGALSVKAATFTCGDLLEKR